jgi:Brp/Blh family beta-carotene 15,15'-monooxygenase
LTLFLIISGIHFGASDIRHIMEYGENHWLPLIAHGGLVCIAIPGFQLSGVAPIFNILIGEHGGSSLLRAISYLLYPYLGVVIMYFGFSLRNGKWKASALNLFSLLLLAFWLPPLVSFAMYFCFWHSRSHVLRIWENIRPAERRKSLIETFIYTGIAWLGAGCFFWYFRESPDSAILQLTFVGLAALTVPHMVLVDLIDSKLHRLIL